MAKTRTYQSFPPEIEETMITCALRFDGYRYIEIQEGQPGGDGWDFTQLVRPIVEQLVLSADEAQNFAAFFALQRYLFKWGGEGLTKFSAEHLAFDFLFLHLYTKPVPREFQDEQYCLQWDRGFAAQSEAAAAFVRNSLRRKGRGKPTRIAR